MQAHQLVAPFQFECRDIAPPNEGALTEGDVLLRSRAGGVCGSDLPFFAGRRAPTMSAAGMEWPPKPGFPMHEIVGTVVASRHPAIHEGADVVGWASNSDALAELVVCRGDELAGYDASLAPQVAVALQPLACVLYAVEQLGEIAGATATVLGLGPIGLLFAHVLRTRGVASVTGVDRVGKRDIAARFDVDRVVHHSSDRWASASEHSDTDIVIEAIGHQSGTLNDAVRLARPGGQIYYFGIPDERSYVFEVDEFLRRGLTLRSGVTKDRRRMLAAAGDYAAEHPTLLADLVTDVFPIDEVTAAYRQALTPADAHAKVVVAWP